MKTRMKRRKVPMNRGRDHIKTALIMVLCVALAVLGRLGVFSSLVAAGECAAPNIEQELLSMAFPMVNGYTFSKDTEWAYVTPAPTETASVDFKPNIQPSDAPRIMIYSSHSNEAYTGKYKQSGSYRTLDRNNNIMRISGELATLLSTEYHMPVYYEETDHEQGKHYNTAYNRSLASMQKRKKQYPSLDVFIDIHRDAYSSEKTDMVVIDGKEVARIMIVVGTGEGQTGSGFKEKPNWKANKKFGDALFSRLEANAPGIGRKVLVKSGRYNQHVADMCLAIEVGYTGNNLQQALNAIPYLAKSLYEVLSAS